MGEEATNEVADQEEEGENVIKATHDEHLEGGVSTRIKISEKSMDHGSHSKIYQLPTGDNSPLAPSGAGAWEERRGRPGTEVATTPAERHRSRSAPR